MGYQSWFKKQGHLHKQVIDKLLQKGLSKEQIVAYFDFENMVKEEPDFCPLYVKNKKCHDIEKLNCFLCACPFFRFKEEGYEVMDGKTRFSDCSIHSKHGRHGTYGDAIHQDCSKCTVPHRENFVLKNYNTNWFEAMKDCDESSAV